MLIFLLLVVVVENIRSAPKLLQIQAVSRHGVRERTSSNFIPNLPCLNFSRNQSITELGRIQNYLSGKGLRDTAEYGSLFGDGKYNSANQIFMSTDEPKTVSSIQSVFQGVFYNDYKNTSSQDFYITPSFVPGSVDYALNAAALCSTKIRAIRATVDPVATDEWKQKQTEYAKAFLKIYENTGFGPNVAGTPGRAEALTLDTIPRAAEQIILAYEHGFTHPDHHCVYPKHVDVDEDDSIDEFIDLNKVAIDGATFRNKMQNRPYNTTPGDGEMAKLQASPYFNMVIREFLAKTGVVDETELKKRSFIYVAGNNANILAPIQLVGRESFGRAPFGSVFFFELYVDDAKALPYTEDDLLVKVGWRNFTVREYNNTDQDDAPLDANFKLVEAVGLASYSAAEWYTTDLCGVGKDFCTISDLRKRVYTDDEWKIQCNISTTTPPGDNDCKNTTDDPNKGNSGNNNIKDNSDDDDKAKGLNAGGYALLAVVIVLAVLLIAAIIVALHFAVRAKACATAAAAAQASVRALHQKSGTAEAALPQEKQKQRQQQQQQQERKQEIQLQQVEPKQLEQGELEGELEEEIGDGSEKW